jgi:hypothetical protein
MREEMRKGFHDFKGLIHEKIEEVLKKEKQMLDNFKTSSISSFTTRKEFAQDSST